MFMKRKKQLPGSNQRTGAVEILFDRRIFDYMLQELSKDLSVEEGGKYVGYLLTTGDPLLEKIGSRAKRAIAIVDFLPSGPNAVRTAVELMPDGPYQEALFREIEKRDAAIEHVGTWHSHHCNGLRRLSNEDVAGYLRTVNNPSYRPNYLVASLVKDVPGNAKENGWIDHFLFIRGVTEPCKITDTVQVVELTTPFGALTGHIPSDREAVPDAMVEVPPAPQEQRPPSAWFETAEGRSVLAEDKRFFDRSFDSVVATRRESRVTITGRKGSRVLAVTFPSDAANQTVSVMVKVDDLATIGMECALANRSLAYRAALAVLVDS